MKSKPSRAAPISAHRLFPAIVALWFAALFGIGSLVLPAALLNKIVTATHAGALVPSMAPPIGFTARMLIALGVALIGAIAGIWLARKVVAAQEVTPSRRWGMSVPQAPQDAGVHTDPPVRRPISAREELDLDALDNAAVERTGIRRRSLAVDEEGGSSDWLRSLSIAVPDEEKEAPEPRLARDDRALELDATLELTSFATAETDSAPPVAAAPMPETIPEPPMAMPEISAPQPIPESRPFVAPQQPLAEQPSFAPPQAAASCAPRMMATAGQELAIEQAAMVRSDELPGPDLAELAERLRHAIANRTRPQMPAPLIADAPIAADGGVQSFFAAPAASASPGPAPVSVPPVAADAPAATLIPAIPAALRPIDFGESDEDDDPHGLLGLDMLRQSQPDLTAPAQPASPFSGTFDPVPGRSGSLDAIGGEAGPDDEFDEEGEDESAAYSSLLSMRNPIAPKAEFVRIEVPEHEDEAIEPVVVFPGQEVRRTTLDPAGIGRAQFADPALDIVPALVPQPAATPSPAFARQFDPAPDQAPAAAPTGLKADPAETERALRAALATLQRMSGAA